MTAKPDWEAIERAYRAGLLSVREIAASSGISHTAIQKRASKEGWQRDLTDKVRCAVKAKVAKAVATDGCQLEVATDAQIIEEASDQAAAIVLAHRSGLALWRGIANKLSAYLAEADVNDDNHGDFARSLNAGVDAQLKVIKGERQAYNLGDDNGEGDKGDTVTRIELVAM
ncbi:hypothetical protein [Pseudomonas fluorescens]|uniref:hypothetical protein n=1 Tax=Pseudomonas fluorescens TaxID=294 RepID=UPI0005FB342E|nr:hypothetical protein [Pseudomonas fluorescens]KJZ41325.1 phage-like protein [Pseudomonas fluorescens]